MRTDVYATSNSKPSALRSLPASLPSFSPCSVKLTSCQPVKRFSLFQILSPWRSKTNCIIKVKIYIALMYRNNTLYVFNQIVKLEASNLINRLLENKQITLILDDLVVEFIAKKEATVEYGARPIRRAIEKYLEDSIAEEILKKNEDTQKNISEISAKFQHTKNSLINSIPKEIRKMKIKEIKKILLETENKENKFLYNRDNNNNSLRKGKIFN